MAIEINEEVRASLTEAGIGPRFHDRSLVSVPSYGDKLMQLLHEHGDDIKRAGRSLAWHGVGTTESITMFGRALHVNAIGVFMRPLVRLRPIFNDPEFREHATDVPVLIILNAQDTKRGCPLHDGIMSDLEYLIRKRHDASRSTFLQLAIPEDTAAGDLPNCYWSDEFLSLLSEEFIRVTPSQLLAPGAIK